MPTFKRVVLLGIGRPADHMSKDGEKESPPNFERCLPEGQRFRLMQNKVRNQLSLIFKAPQLRRLERAIRCRNRPATQSLLEELSGVPEGLKAAAQKLLAGFRPDPELPPKQASAEPKAHTVPPPKAVPPGLRVGAPPETGEDAQPLPVKAKALPLQPKFKAKGPAPVKPGQEPAAAVDAASPSAVASPIEQPATKVPPVLDDFAAANATLPATDEAAPWKKRRRGDRPTAGAPGPAEPIAAEVRSAPKSAKDLSKKVLLSNVPTSASSKELLEFFHGAVCSATGHMLPPEVTAEKLKVVEGVEIHRGGHAEVVFATAPSASIATLLNGIQFQNKGLSIRRPPGFSAPPVNRSKLLASTLEDLVSGELPKELLEPDPPARPPAAAAPKARPATVQLSGIPPSMNGTSVFDLLTQFGGPVKSLHLSHDRSTGEHSGAGTAEFVDYDSAVEACRFSPLLGFIELTLEEPAPEHDAGMAADSEVSHRRSRWSEDADDDLGPFNAILPPKQPAEAADDDEDLGPFNAVLPKRVAPPEDDDLDLGPFNEILPPKAAPAHEEPEAEDDDDLGPFNAILGRF
ncbi:U2AF2 [Symbiodinium natans]|uniref:U2AF2 protein n=1 Tax=Symbiodinium natans TaxID=878477 RepID=A0A812PF75_9DINO|nr:U2AF2 [Symbiodinium natans]